MNDMEIVIHAESEMIGVAEKILEVAADRRKLAFYGEIGAGKTTLIQNLCELLKVQDYVTSPTFAIINVYETSGNPVHHMDLYRLKQLEGE